MLGLYYAFSLGVVGGAAGYLTWHYPNAQTGLLVKLNAFLAWFASLSMLVLAPADIWVVLHGHEGRVVPLALWWQIAYWYAFVAMVLILPLLQGYAESGDFTLWDKIMYTLKYNGKFYGGVLLLGLLGIIILAVMDRFAAYDLQGWLMGVSNAYGLIGALFLMGYGLVDIPRKLWQKSDMKRRVLLLYHYAGVQVEKAAEAHRQLAKVIGIVNRVSELFGRRDRLRPYMDQIERMTDKVDEVAPEEIDMDDEEVDLDYFTQKDLGELRRRLRQAIEGFEREKEKYLQLIRDYFRIQDILKNMDRIGCPYSSDAHPDRPSWLGHIEWWWRCRIEAWAMKFLAFLLCLVSLAVIIGEVGISKKLPNLSLFAFFLQNMKDRTVGILALSFSVLLYLCICTYYTLFKLGRFSFYLLVPRHTAPYSLLTNALFMARFSFPLAYNFLAAIALPAGKKHVDPDLQETEFFRTLGHPMQQAPGIGLQFTTYVPLIIVPYTVLVLFNVFNRVVALFDRSQRFSFDEDWDTATTYASTGQTMLQRELENKEMNLPMGLTISQGVHSGLANSGRALREPRSNTAGFQREKNRHKSTYQSQLEQGVGHKESWHQDARTRLSDAVARVQGADRRTSASGPRSAGTSRLDSIFSQVVGGERPARGEYATLQDESAGNEGERQWFRFGGKSRQGWW